MVRDVDSTSIADHRQQPQQQHCNDYFDIQHEGSKERVMTDVLINFSQSSLCQHSRLRRGEMTTAQSQIIISSSSTAMIISVNGVNATVTG